MAIALATAAVMTWSPPGSVVGATPANIGIPKESMPLPPSDGDLAKFRAINEAAAGLDGLPEGSADVTTSVVTHTVYARVAADEEYRSHFGSSCAGSTCWQNFSNSVVESADDYLFSLYGIDVYVTSYYSGWTSSPNTSRDACTLLSDLVAHVPQGTYDVVLGYSKNASQGGKGCSVGDYTITLWHGAATGADERYAEWAVQRHEIAHLYGAPDRYPDLGNVHPMDLMENQYLEPDYLCTNIRFDDYYIVYSDASKYDN